MAAPDGLGEGRWQLTFSDEFDGHSLDGWNECFWWSPDGCTLAANGEEQWYVPGAVETSDGRARLRAERRVIDANGRRYPYRSSMLTTGPADSRARPDFAFTYGYMEARLRVNVAAGAWPRFWLAAASKRRQPVIDMLSVYGSEPDVLRPQLRSSIGSRRVAPGTTLGLGIGTAWHTYALWWEPGRLVWLFDGRPVWEINGSAVPSEPMYLVATLAVGGPAGPPTDEPLLGTFELDWVRVWQR